MNTKSSHKILAVNRKAKRNYQIVETLEAGIALKGNEVKSIRAGKANLAEGYVRYIDGELWLIGVHISEYKHNSDPNYDPLRKRKLLLHKREIMRLKGKSEERGFTMVPLSLYLKRGRVKVELALAKGRLAPDKRANIKEREAKRRIERALKYKN